MCTTFFFAIGDLKCAAIAIIVVIIVGGKLMLGVPVSEGLVATLTFLATAHNQNSLVSKCLNFPLEACLMTPLTRIWYELLLYPQKSCSPHLSKIVNMYKLARSRLLAKNQVSFA
jgi:hypothetical protein